MGHRRKAQERGRRAPCVAAERLPPEGPPLRRLVAVALVAGFAGFGLIGVVNATPWVSTSVTEGHTVFVSVGRMPGPNGTSLDAAAVAVLVRDAELGNPWMRFPGVLWFNDQYLVNPAQVGPSGPRAFRHPCSGAVLVTESGRPDPRHYVHAMNASSYVESYHLTDPNGNRWDVDKWNITPERGARFLVWTVAINNEQARAMTPDDGASDCPPKRDLGCPLASPYASCDRPPRSAESIAAEPLRHECDIQRDCALQYNAVLIFRLSDFYASGAPRNHSTNASGDVSACHPGSEWGCPGDDDDAEGYSHPYDPLLLNEDWDGATADCTGDGVHDSGCHRTVDVDIYYGIAPQPPQRWYALLDDRIVEGGTCRTDRVEWCGAAAMLPP